MSDFEYKHKPGSDEAAALGCKCPRLDNARGRGAYGTSGKKAIYIVDCDCPVHYTPFRRT